MAKARKPTAPPTEKIADAEEFDFSDALDAASLSPHLARLQAELGVDGDGAAFKVHVSRITAEGKDARVWDGPPEDYDLMHIARQYGGSGDYRVKLYGPHETGRTVIRANEIMTVLLSPEEDRALHERRNPQLPQNNGFDLQAMVAAITQANTAMLAPLLARPTANPLDDLAKLAEVVKTMMPAPVTPVVATGNSFAEMLANFRALKELTAPAAAETGDTGSYALNKGVDVIASMMAEHTKNRATPQLAAPVPVVNTAVAELHTSEENEEMQLQAKLLAFRLRALNTKAVAKAVARDEAESIYEDLPDDVLHMLQQDPRWFKFLCQLVPECAPQREWFELLRIRIVEMGLEDGVLSPGLTANQQPGTTSIIESADALANGNTGSSNDAAAGGTGKS